MNRKMECTYSVVPDHIAQSVSLSDAAFRLIVWMLSKRNQDRIADFSRLNLQVDKQDSISELINKNYLQQDGNGLFINPAIMFEDFTELATKLSVKPSVESAIGSAVEIVNQADPSINYFQQVFDLIALYSHKKLNFNNLKFRVRCDEFMRQGFTIEHIKILCIQLQSRNAYFDWYELEATELQHIKDVTAVTNANNASAQKTPVYAPSYAPGYGQSEMQRQFQPTPNRQGARNIQNQSSFMASYHQIKQDPHKMADIKQIYNYWYESKQLPQSQYVAPKPAHFEKLHSLLNLHSIAELKRAVDGVAYRRDLVNKGRSFNDIFTNSNNISDLVDLANKMDMSQTDGPELRIFNYWLERTQAASGLGLRMTVSQRDVLLARLQIFSEADLKLAIDGAQQDSYYQSVNFAFGLIFKDDTQVHQLMAQAVNGKPNSAPATRKDTNVNKALADMGISKLSVGQNKSRPQSRFQHQHQHQQASERIINRGDDSGEMKTISDFSNPQFGKK